MEKKLITYDFIKENVKIALRPKSPFEDNYIETDSMLDGVDQYLYMMIDGKFPVRVIPQMLEAVNMPQRTVWGFARKNTFKESVVYNICDITGCDIGFKFYVFTNESKFLGASAILNRNLLKDCASKIGTKKVVVIPSSVHECLLVEYSDGMRPDVLDTLVKFVNAKDVPIGEVLADRAYVFDVKEL